MKLLLIMALGLSILSAHAGQIENLFGIRKPIIGTINLLPSLGQNEFPGMKELTEQALADLKVLEAAGVDGVLIENLYDYPGEIEASKETVASMTAVVSAVVNAARNVVVGCEFLLNDPKASLAIAKAAGAKFIRTDFFVDRMTNSSGEMKIDPKGLMKYRQYIEAENILILADIQVKYATMINQQKTIAESARHAEREKADGIVVTGRKSGEPPSSTKLKAAQEAVHTEIVIGSGFAADNAFDLLRYADAVIVGTSMRDEAGNLVPAKAKHLMKVVKAFRETK